MNTSHLRPEEYPIVIGLGFGDEGKGTIVDFLCQQRKTDYVIRFSGGPQTAHNVVTSDGREHTFALFGSGTFQGAGTILTKEVLVNPFNLVAEANALNKLTGRDVLDTLLISENALLITPLHVLANQQREINRGNSRHGSCGQGVGEAKGYALRQTPEDPIRMQDLKDLHTLKTKLIKLNDHLRSAIPNFDGAMDIENIMSSYEAMMTYENLRIMSDDRLMTVIGDRSLTFVVEGSQGVLLDEDYGFIPHTTWSSVVSKNAERLLIDAGVSEKDITVIGITRTYTTRHGAGPFPSEYLDPKTIALYPEKHNAWGEFQGGWRVGALDVSLLTYALEVNDGVDWIALTHCDVLPVKEAVVGWEKEFRPAPRDPAYQYSELTETAKSVIEPSIETYEDVDGLAEIINRVTNTNVSLLSFGPTAEDKRWDC